MKNSTNRLALEKSPYLLQHAHNPVDWYPWGVEAFEKARKEDKPVFLSIGYSTCHWCHVMEKESFETEEVAEALNKGFISIKVDREERPDIDQIYMTVCQMITQRGGWPLTIIMTAEQKPFFAGTYIPKLDNSGSIGLLSIFERVQELWSNDRAKIIESGESIVQGLINSRFIPADLSFDAILKKAYHELLENFDSEYGGFGSAPKFPSAHNLLFLLRYWYVNKEQRALEMVETTLEKMSRGGIWDHIGFGFCRYSTDREWLVPHFEMMLYDNAWLATAYLELFQVTKKESYALVVKNLFTYISQEMSAPEGGFYSALDADSEGVEGKYYVWSRSDVIDVLGEPDGIQFCDLYDISLNGNFEGSSIPNLLESEIAPAQRQWADTCREKLLAARLKRTHPGLDDKILTSWNGLMIAALSIGSRVLSEPKYLESAEKAIGFIFKKMIGPGGRLMARYRDGETAIKGFLDDYSFLIWGLIECYQSSYKPDYLKKALVLTQEAIELFWDPDNGGFFLTGKDSESLIERPKDYFDNAMSSGNSVMASNMVRLARLTNDFNLENIAMSILKSIGTILEEHPRGFTYGLCAVMHSIKEAQEVVFVSPSHLKEAQTFIDTLRSHYRPFTEALFYDKHDPELLQLLPHLSHYSLKNNQVTAYVCEHFACMAPTTDPAHFEELLQM